MDRLTFNGLLLAFFVICDVITWSFVSNGKDPLPILFIENGYTFDIY